MTNPNPFSETPELPDDPAAICRAILDALQNSGVAEWPQTTAPGDYVRLCRVLLAAREEGVGIDSCIPALQNMAEHAEDAADAYHDVFQRVWTLARHGTGEHRAGDAISAAQKRISEAGGEPPNWLNWQWPDIVNRRMRQAAEAGETLSEAEAVERLIAEGPPPLSHGQQRLVELVDAMSKLKGEKADRLLATARELVEEPDAA